MRVDIIVPNFDDSSDEVTLSAWYKKIGDKISKNEVIADAETIQIACGITSSYDCILAKILVKEGDIISQGTKIAIIETDLNADIGDIKQAAEIESARQQSESISANIQNDVKEEQKKKEQEEKEQTASSWKTSDNNDAHGKASSGSYGAPPSSLSSETYANGHSNNGYSGNNGYSLSATPSGSEANGYAGAAGSSNSYVFNVVDAERSIEEAEIFAEEEIIDDLSEQTEERVASILKAAEYNAKEEAKKLGTQIIEDAKRNAILKAEEIKVSILREYEEKATKDASEMHQKIVQGSLLEAENTRAALLNEAQSKAKQEAELLKIEILKLARIEAEIEANKKAEEAANAALADARIQSEKKAKEIIEDSIHEAKIDARAIKRDIIHSANKHAARESRGFIKESLREAKVKAKLQAVKIIETAVEQASAEAESVKNEIIRSVIEEIRRTTHYALRDAIEKTDREIGAIVKSTLREVRSSVDRESQEALDKMHSNLKSIERESEKEIARAIKSTAEESINECNLGKRIVEEQVEEILQSEAEVVRSLLKNSCEYCSLDDAGVQADTWNKPKFFASPNDENVPIDFLKQRINEKLKSSMESSIISTVSNEVDMTAVLTLEKNFGHAFSKKYNTRLGFTPFFILASIDALKTHRVFNAHINENNIIYKNNYDISVITCGNDGILAPVIRQTDSLSLADIEKAMITLSRRAIEGTLSVEEVSGGTFTVVNAGVYGSLMGTDLLTIPQVATLSIHRMHNRPIATDSGVEIRPMLYISLSYDHRVADTKQASEFLVQVKRYVENPGWTILGL